MAARRAGKFGSARAEWSSQWENEREARGAGGCGARERNGRRRQDGAVAVRPTQVPKRPGAPSALCAPVPSQIDGQGFLADLLDPFSFI